MTKSTNRKSWSKIIKTNVGSTDFVLRVYFWSIKSFPLEVRENTGNTQGKHREYTGKTHGAHREYAMTIGHKNTKIIIF